MKLKPFLTTVLLLGATAGLAIAGPRGRSRGQQPPLPADIIAQYDTDGDGVLSEAEKAAMKAALEAARLALIAKYDLDGDGVLNTAERAAMQADREAARLAEQTAKFVVLDVDSSGGLTLPEFTAGAPADASAERILAAFTRLDTDGDGLISLAEFTAEPTPPADAGPGNGPPGRHRGKDRSRGGSGTGAGGSGTGSGSGSGQSSSSASTARVAS